MALVFLILPEVIIISAVIKVVIIIKRDKTIILKVTRREGIILLVLKIFYRGTRQATQMFLEILITLRDTGLVSITQQAIIISLVSKQALPTVREQQIILKVTTPVIQILLVAKTIL